MRKVRFRRNAAMKRILVVDDDPTYLTLEESVLKREGYEVVTAEDGTKAMTLYQEQDFDLVLLDVMMPGVDGFEVSRTLREGDRQKKVPVVFVTSKDDSKSMQEGFRSGGRVYLTKPFTNFQLVKMVKSVIGD
jgi:DNA-binding response OmpR family regulator